MSFRPKPQRKRPVATSFLYGILSLGIVLGCVEVLLCPAVLGLSTLIPLRLTRPFLDLALSMGAGLGMCLVGGGIVGSRWKTKHGQTDLRLLPILSLIMILSALAAIPWMLSDATPRQITFNPKGFSQASINLTEGESLTLSNRSSTRSQTVCLGTNRRCDPSAPGPKALQAPGLTLLPDHVSRVTFSEPGEYHLTLLTAQSPSNLVVFVDACVYINSCGGD